MNVGEQSIVAARGILNDFGLPGDDPDDESMAMLIELMIGTLFEPKDLWWIRSGISDNRKRLALARDSWIRQRLLFESGDPLQAEKFGEEAARCNRRVAQLDRILVTLGEVVVEAYD